jgi:hypothetical protein
MSVFQYVRIDYLYGIQEVGGSIPPGSTIQKDNEIK